MRPLAPSPAPPRGGRFALALLVLVPVLTLAALDRVIVHWTGLWTWVARELPQRLDPEGLRFWNLTVAGAGVVEYGMRARSLAELEPRAALLMVHAASFGGADWREQTFAYDARAAARMFGARELVDSLGLQLTGAGGRAARAGAPPFGAAERAPGLVGARDVPGRGARAHPARAARRAGRGPGAARVASRPPARGVRGPRPARARLAERTAL